MAKKDKTAVAVDDTTEEVVAPVAVADSVVDTEEVAEDQSSEEVDTNSEGTLKARPKSGHKDPLAEGVRLHNVSNSSDAKTYEVSENPVDAVRPKATVGEGAKAPMPVMPAHKTKNASKDEQNKVAAGRKEKAVSKK